MKETNEKDYISNDQKKKSRQIILFKNQQTATIKAHITYVCMICYSEDNEDLFLVKKCGHNYHKDCIRDYLINEVNNSNSMDNFVNSDK